MTQSDVMRRGKNTGNGGESGNNEKKKKSSGEGWVRKGLVFFFLKLEKNV